MNFLDFGRMLFWICFSTENNDERRHGSNKSPLNTSIQLVHALEDGEIKKCDGNFYNDHHIYLPIRK